METKWEILRRKWATLPNLTNGSSKMNARISIGFDNMVVVGYLDHCDPNGRIKACWNLEVRQWTVIWGNSFEEFCYKEQQVELGTRVRWKIKEGQCFGVGAGQHVCWWVTQERRKNWWCREATCSSQKREDPGHSGGWGLDTADPLSQERRQRARVRQRLLLGWQLK